MKKKWISFLLFFFVVVCGNAQTTGYKFYAALDSVKASGFYNIAITPELSAHLKTDYSDVRIVNDSGKWVPHLLHFYEDKKSNEAFDFNLKYTITDNDKNKTILVIRSPEQIISNIGLVISNTTAKRFCTLSGSNDSKIWFTINDSILIDPTFNNDPETNTELAINFPSSNYKFFKILIKNDNKDPFNILGVTHQTSSRTLSENQTKLIVNPQSVIQQKDSGKISYIKITQQQAYHFSSINLKLSGVKYFSRKAEVYIPTQEQHSFSNPGQLLQSFIISNNSTLQFKVPLSNAPVFYLLINNEDNLPLKVDSVNTAYYPVLLTTYLEKGNRYKLILNNLAATLPQYDLPDTLNKDSIPFLLTQKIIPLAENPVTLAASPKNNNWILWVAIIAVLFILLLFTKKMVTEVNKRKEHDSI